MEQKDGFITNLFSFLHKPNTIKHQFFTVNIPDTIIYTTSLPRQWFFSHNGQVKLKSRVKLDEQYIKEYFLSFGQDIIALWISELEGNQLQYEYMNEERFLQFLGTTGLRQGILQRFIYPKGSYNHTIRVLYTKQFCYFEKYVSKTDIMDLSKDIYLRALTYEKNPSLAVSLTSKSIHQKLEHICGSIAEHIQDITQWRNNISKMILSFRIDQNNKIWLLGCQSMKFQESDVDDNKCRFDNTQNIKLPDYIDINRLVLRQPQVVKDCICFRCEHIFNSDDLMKIKIKDIVESWQFDHLGNIAQLAKPPQQIPKLMTKKTLFEKMKGSISLKEAVNPGKAREVGPNYLVPDLIRKIYPKMKEQAYRELLPNPGFSQTEIDVCYDCHLYIDRGVNVQADPEKLEHLQQLTQQQFFGTQQLRPEIIKKRHIITLGAISDRKERRVVSKLSLKSVDKRSKEEQSLASLITGIYPIQSSIMTISQQETPKPKQKLTISCLRSVSTSRKYQQPTALHTRRESNGF